MIKGSPTFSIAVDSQTITVSGTVQITGDPTVYKVFVCVWKREEDAKKLGCDPSSAAKIKGSPDGSIAIKNDGTFKATLDGEIPTMNYISVEIGGKDHPSVTYSPIPRAGTLSANKPAKEDFILNVNQAYCDQALPSRYQGSVLTVVTPKAWQDEFTRAAERRQSSGMPPSQVNFADRLAEFGYANASDPIQHGVINDAGYPILDGRQARAGLNGWNVQRMLLRTLFPYNPSRAPCSYKYLSNRIPSADESVLDADAETDAILTEGAGQPWFLRGRQAPKYYLLNVVRWMDAPNPGAAAGTSPAYQAASDDWYLLNYSDAAAHHRDLFSAFRRFRPELERDAMRILGKSDVLFVGIHLAPLAPTDHPSPVTNAGIDLIPTERAWFDRVKIRYKLHADKAQPVQVQDLGLLAAILLRDVLASGVALIEGTTSKAAPGQTPFDCHPPGEINFHEFEAAVLDGISSQIQKVDPLRRFLTNADQRLRVAVTADENVPRWLCGNKISENQPSPCVQNLDDLARRVSQERQRKSVEKVACEAWISVQRSLAEISNTPVYSLYQGRYGAGLITNLRTLPSDLTASWTASLESGPIETGITGQKESSATESVRRSKVSTTSRVVGNPEAEGPCILGMPQASDGSDAQSSCTNVSSVIRDEGFAFWDASVAVTTPGYSDLSIQQSSGAGSRVLSSSHITRFNAYGMIDMYLLGKQDLVQRPVLGIPHVSVGLPFAGRPLDRPYFAFGETINLPSALNKIGPRGWRDRLANYLPFTIRPLFGWVWNKESRPSLAGGRPLAFRALKPQWAIEVSFKDIKNAASKLSKE